MSIFKKLLFFCLSTFVFAYTPVDKVISLGGNISTILIIKEGIVVSQPNNIKEVNIKFSQLEILGEPFDIYVLYTISGKKFARIDHFFFKDMKKCKLCDEIDGGRFKALSTNQTIEVIDKINVRGESDQLLEAVHN